MARLYTLGSRIIPLFTILSSVFFSRLLYDTYQLPKAAALAAALLFSMPFLFFIRRSGLSAAAAALAFGLSLYFPALLIASGSHPPLYYGLLFFAPLCFFVFYSGRFDTAAVSALLNLLFFASACYGLFQFVILKINRPYSFFGNPIFFAEFCGALMPFLIYGLASKGRLKYLSGLNLIIFPAILILCSSRGAIISAAVSFCLMLAYIFRAGIKIFPVKKYGFILAAAALAGLLFFPGAFNSLKTTASRFASLSSLSAPEIRHRAILAETSLNIFLDSPVTGMGPGAVRQLHQQKQAMLLKNNPSLDFVNSSYSHNDYMQLLAETGAAGLLLFLAFVFISTLAFERASAYMPQEKFFFGSAAVTSILFFLSESFFNFPLFSLPSAVLFYSFCGMMVSLSADTEEEQKNLPAPAAAAAAAVVLGLLAIYLVKDKPAAFAANFYLKSPEQKQDAAPGGPVKAARLEPDNFYAQFYCGQAALAQGLHENAFLHFEKILFYFPYSADALYDAGYALFLQNKHGEAVKYYDRALFLYPDFAAACRGMYTALMAQGKETEALLYLERAVKIDAENGTDYLKDKGIMVKELTR